jgi:S-DNA-T family DNA segregation ATPase FtsK/SpoIIIE
MAKRKSRRTRSRSALAIAFDGRGHDVWGIVFVVLGLVAGLGIYADAAGSLGEALADATGWAVGVVNILVPILAVLFGYLLMRGTAENGRGTETVGTLVGGVMALVAIEGFCHLFGGRPDLRAGAEALGDAGGVLGWVIAGPLTRVASVYGAFIILAAVGLVGGLLFTGMPMATIIDGVRTGFGPLRDGTGRFFRSLFRIDEDADADGSAAAVPARSRRRRGKAAASEAGYEEALDEYDTAADETDEVDVEGGVTDDDLDGVDDAAEYLYPDDGESDGHDAEDELEAEDGLEDGAGEDTDAVVPAKPPRKKAAPVAWKLPPLSLLKRSSGREIDKAAVRERGRLLERALAEHGVQTRLVGMVVGPTVTRYELELGPGVKVARVTSLYRDIAYAMASPDVRILAPIPGRQAIGVEVPNEQREIVAVGDILASSEARSASHPLEVAVGRDIMGKPVLVNLAAMPHILIAGATGAGKSSCINSLITSVLMRSTPDQVRMILIDPKMVEMGQYERVPHLLTAVVIDPKKAANALSWACREMDRRYELLKKVGFRDITGYNAAHDRGELQAGLGEVDADGEPLQYQRLSYIIVVVDELADLMMVAAKDVEDSIVRIAQKARAVGIHLVIATQRPSVNVITGLIKANVPARLAFAVSSQTDSRVILDQPGAERLVGKGDMLLLTPASSTPNRIQGCWVSEEEVRAVVATWRRQQPIDLTDADPEPETEVTRSLLGMQGEQLAIDLTDDVTASVGDDEDGDELLRQAMELVVTSQLGSTSMLQRKLRVGFARAGRLMDLLEQRGVVGPSEGSKARQVLMRPEDLHNN